MLLPLFIALLVEKILNQSLQEMTLSNPHSGGDWREEKVVSMGEVRATSGKSLEHQFQDSYCSRIEKCSNYMFFVQAKVGCMSQ